MRCIAPASAVINKGARQRRGAARGEKGDSVGREKAKKNKRKVSGGVEKVPVGKIVRRATATRGVSIAIDTVV